jgi:hypothetical protein
VRKGTTRGLAARLLEDLSLKMSQTSFTDSIQSIAATIWVEQTTLAASLVISKQVTATQRPMNFNLN